MTAYRFSKPWKVCFDRLNYFGRIVEFSWEFRFDFLEKFRMNGMWYAQFCPIKKDTSLISSFPQFVLCSLSSSLSFSTASFICFGHTLIQNLRTWNRSLFLILTQWPLSVLPLFNHILCVTKGFLWDLHMKLIVEISSVLLKCLPLGCAHTIQDVTCFSKDQRYIKIYCPNCPFMGRGKNRKSNGINQIMMIIRWMLPWCQALFWTLSVNELI